MNNSLLAFEMAIDMRSDNAHFAGDILDPGTGDAPALEAARGGVDDRIRRTLLCGRRLASAGLPLLSAAAKATPPGPPPRSATLLTGGHDRPPSTTGHPASRETP